MEDEASLEGSCGPKTRAPGVGEGPGPPRELPGSPPPAQTPAADTKPRAGREGAAHGAPRPRGSGRGMGAGEARPPPPARPDPAKPLAPKGDRTAEGEEEGRGGSYPHLSAPPAASRRPWLPGVPRSLRLLPRVSRGPEGLPPPPRRPPPPSHTLRHAGDRGGHRREPGEASERARPRERAPPQAATTSPPTWRPARHRAHAPRRRPRARGAPRPGARERVRGEACGPRQSPADPAGPATLPLPGEGPSYLRRPEDGVV